MKCITLANKLSGNIRQNAVINLFKPGKDGPGCIHEHNNVGSRCKYSTCGKQQNEYRDQSLNIFHAHTPSIRKITLARQ